MGQWDGKGCLGLLVVSGRTRILSGKFKYACNLRVVLINNFSIKKRVEFDISFNVPYNLYLLIRQVYLHSMGLTLREVGAWTSDVAMDLA